MALNVVNLVKQSEYLRGACIPVWGESVLHVTIMLLIKILSSFKSFSVFYLLVLPLSETNVGLYIFPSIVINSGFIYLYLYFFRAA